MKKWASGMSVGQKLVWTSLCKIHIYAVSFQKKAARPHVELTFDSPLTHLWLTFDSRANAITADDDNKVTQT